MMVSVEGNSSGYIIAINEIPCYNLLLNKDIKYAFTEV